MFTLRFPGSDIKKWADRYKDPREDHLIGAIVPRVKANGYLNKGDFLYICRWKTVRTQSQCEKNSEEFIKSVTETALKASNEQLRIEALTLLKGVDWPTASVILHFGQKDPYPILDFRALWSLGLQEPPQPYNFEFWWEYTQFCRNLAIELGVGMRILDRALWQFSKENQ